MTSPPRLSWQQDKSGCQAWNFYRNNKTKKHYKHFWPHISRGSRVAALIQDLPTQPPTVMMLTGFLVFKEEMSNETLVGCIKRSLWGKCVVSLLLWHDCMLLTKKNVKTGQRNCGISNWKTCGKNTKRMVVLSKSGFLPAPGFSPWPLTFVTGRGRIRGTRVPFKKYYSMKNVQKPWIHYHRGD